MMMMTIKGYSLHIAKNCLFIFSFKFGPLHFGATYGGSVLINKIEDKTNVEKN